MDENFLDGLLLSVSKGKYVFIRAVQVTSDRDKSKEEEEDDDDNDDNHILYFNSDKADRIVRYHYQFLYCTISSSSFQSVSLSLRSRLYVLPQVLEFPGFLFISSLHLRALFGRRVSFVHLYVSKPP